MSAQPADAVDPVLISHVLCPYVQRAVIVLTEKRIPFRRVDIDLADKPEWFRAISPLGKVPLLRIDDTVLFGDDLTADPFSEGTRPLCRSRPDQHPFDGADGAHRLDLVERHSPRPEHG